MCILKNNLDLFKREDTMKLGNELGFLQDYRMAYVTI